MNTEPPNVLQFEAVLSQHERSSFWAMQCRVSNFCKAAAP